jgi:hypothetical protein
VIVRTGIDSKTGNGVTFWITRQCCGTRCSGVFDGAPGKWGARRQPVRLAAL